MAMRLEGLWQRVSRRGSTAVRPAATAEASERRRIAAPAVEIAPNDPLVAFFQSAPGAVEIDKLNLDSPALRALKVAGVKLVVPLVSQGELVGLLNLGPRLSEQEYSADDRVLLSNLGTQAGPAVRVAQLVRQQQEEIAERERMEQELRVAQLIQRTLLPRDVPALAGYHVARYYQPAREVGGDFYDFLPLPNGQLGFVIGDVTDKGVPAALVMATTRTVLRAASERLASPGKVLERVNELVCADIPPKMFVTCLYAILDPATGRLRYANAGHDLPYRRYDGGVAELRATGMPLGLMPGMHYEEKETTLRPGETVLLYSDGLVEAHNPAREMFSFGRLEGLVKAHAGGSALIDYLLGELAAFTGPGWEQEDDVTMVVLERLHVAGEITTTPSATDQTDARDEPVPALDGDGWRVLSEFVVASEAGNERPAMEQVADAIRDVDLSPAQIERLKTAVAEATMNAIEHGNKFQADLPVSVRVLESPEELIVSITDRGGEQPIPEAHVPDLEAKLAGLQTPRGWGLFLIKNMVDDMRVTADGHHHTVELILHRGGGRHEGKSA
jgi:serine phosphatase RsbU (regulator of sigma subunit)/anti-sigma regulatory factor (Ser/Thr protein kinase)